MKNALLIGFADEQIPLVNEEIKALKRFFETCEKFYRKRGDIFRFYKKRAEFRHSASRLSRTISPGKSYVFESSSGGRICHGARYLRAEIKCRIGDFERVRNGIE